jgi:hypothetical protein
MKNNPLIFGIIIGVLIISSIYFLTKGNQPKITKYSNFRVVVYKTPTCGCCSEYINYLKAYGFNVETKLVNDNELENLKRQTGIPPQLWSCHTAFIDNYFIEGHIPIEAIDKLLTEKPEINGIALPEMPSGSPGMPGLKLYPFKIHGVKENKDVGIFIEI